MWHVGHGFTDLPLMSGWQNPCDDFRGCHVRSVRVIIPILDSASGVKWKIVDLLGYEIGLISFESNSSETI